MTHRSASHELAPPGAGLPPTELFFARLIFHGRRRFTSRTKVAEKLDAEQRLINELVRALPAEQAGRRVLIERLRGLEDSSRAWSVWMTLEHLRIVNEAVARTISELLAGRRPPGRADTAAVKPSANVDETVITAFNNSCDALRRATASPSLDSAVRFEHPSFGPLDASGWNFLSAFHVGLHRRQIEAICREMKPLP
jgi:hypothetical protein